MTDARPRSNLPPIDEALVEAILFALMDQPPNVEEDLVGSEMVPRKVRLDLATLPQLAAWTCDQIGRALAAMDEVRLSATAGRPVARLVYEPTVVVI